MPCARLLLLLFLVLAAGCESSNTKLRVFIADSLSRPFKEIKKAFEAKHPDVEIVQIPSGSVLCARKITEQNDRADVIAVADYMVIDQMLRPKYAQWSILFATNEVGIAYTDMSIGAAQLTVENWYEILSRPDVKVQAANPFHDPCGYWTELCWKLSDLYYNVEGRSIHDRMSDKCGPPGDRRSDSQHLLRLVELVGGIDYAFVYRSQALQHNLSFLRLSPEIRLGDPQQVDRYRQVSINLSDVKTGEKRQKSGDAIVFAITVPTIAKHPELAEQYVAFILSPEGRAILTDQHMVVTNPPITYDASVPQALTSLVIRRSKPETG